MTQKNNLKVSQPNPMSEDMFSSKKIQNWIQTCERINGLRMMVGMKEWETASRLGFQALCATPFNPSLWKEIFGALKKSQNSRPHQATYSHTQTLLTPKQPL